ncbi:MAG: hypothetical protein C0391_02240 [Anaerolinea sp.]|nr:hypothetical protein [Anaerolinea sp.]
MPTSEERLKVMKMVQEGKISAEEAISLMDALESSIPQPGNTAGYSTGSPGRWFRVKITDTFTGRTRTNIRLPLSLVNAGLKMGAKFSPEMEGLDMNAISDALRKGETGLIIDVQDDKDKEHVEIYIE